MIGKLKGRVEETTESFALIDVQDVCYRVFLSARDLQNLPALGEAVALWIETQVREDHIHLFGFRSEEGKAWFNLLSTVQGVGAKMALAILGQFEGDALLQAIHAKDTKMLTRANGVGPKLAERIVNELKNKTVNVAASLGSASIAAFAAAPSASGVMEEAVSALVNLGYGKAEAFSAVALARQKQPEADLSALIRLGLGELAR